MRVLNFLCIVFVAVLVFMSTIAVIGIQLDLLQNYTISLTPTGFNTFLKKYGEQRSLFGGTMAITALYFSLRRVNAAIVANVEKVKNDRFTEWKTVLELRAKEIEHNDSYMKREFITHRWKFFNELYSRGFEIANKTELEKVFNATFKNSVNFIETQNEKHMKYGGAYPTSTHSYTLVNFRFLFLGAVDRTYQNIDADLQTLYLAAMAKDRIIDQALYQAAISRR